MHLRAVLDTNVIISGALFGGAPRRLLQDAIDRRFSLFISDEIVSELTGVLQRPKFRTKAPLHTLMLAQLLGTAIKVFPVRNSGYRLKDPDDHTIVDCAIAAKADFIVTGDGDFLLHRQIAGIGVITPIAMLEKIIESA